MRKALIAVAVATALFAVGAFAASFAMQAEDTASGTNAVQSCAASAVVDFTETFDNAINNWEITTVTVTLTHAAGLSCAGSDVDLILQDSDDTRSYEPATLENIANGVPSNVAISGTTTTITYTPTDLDVGDVWNAAVLVDGLQIDTTPA